MPKFTVEMTSGGGSQMEVEAPSPMEAIKEVFYAAAQLEDYDDKSDPDQHYHGRFTDKPWKRVVVSISPPFWYCATEGCFEEVDKDGGVCDGCAAAQEEKPTPTTYNVSFNLKLALTVNDVEAFSEEEAEEKAKSIVDKTLIKINADIDDSDYDDFEFEEAE